MYKYNLGSNKYKKYRSKLLSIRKGTWSFFPFEKHNVVVCEKNPSYYVN